MNEKELGTTRISIFAVFSILIIGISLLMPMNFVSGQEEYVEIWHISLSTSQPFINEELLINVTGEKNASVSIKFENLDKNDTITKWGFIDETGYWQGKIRFDLGENGTYLVKLLTYGEMKDSTMIEVIYDENQAQNIMIDDLKKDIARLEAKNEEIVKNQNKQLALYHKWLLVYFTLWAINTVCFLIYLRRIWPELKDDWAKWRMERKQSRRMSNVFTSRFKDYRYEFGGYSHKEPTLTLKDDAIMSTDVGKTKREILRDRREKMMKLHPEDFEDEKMISLTGKEVDDIEKEEKNRNVVPEKIKKIKKKDGDRK